MIVWERAPSPFQYTDEAFQGVHIKIPQHLDPTAIRRALRPCFSGEQLHPSSLQSAEVRLLFSFHRRFFSPHKKILAFKHGDTVRQEES